MNKVIDEPAFRNKMGVFRDRSHAGRLLAQKITPSFYLTIILNSLGIHVLILLCRNRLNQSIDN